MSDSQILITTGEVSADTVAYIAGAITDIFDAGFRTHQSQKVMLAALKTLDVVRPISSGHTISNCVFDSRTDARNVSMAEPMKADQTADFKLKV